jgi:hypothetical protein
MGKAAAYPSLAFRRRQSRLTVGKLEAVRTMQSIRASACHIHYSHAMVYVRADSAWGDPCTDTGSISSVRANSQYMSGRAHGPSAYTVLPQQVHHHFACSVLVHDLELADATYLTKIFST